MSDREFTEDRWNALLRVTRSWRLEWNVEHLLYRVSKEAVELLGLERGIVFMVERSGIISRAVWPELKPGERELVMPLSRQVAQQVIQSGRPVFAHELGDLDNKDKARDANVRVVFCVPLTAGRGILGALYVDSRESQKGLTQKDQEFLEMLGLQAAVALEHAILYQSAITDPLTGLFSHRHFQQEVEQAVRRALRAEEPVTLLLMDLDRFKELNDTCGHAAGNQCLTDVAGILRGALRTTDVIARFGGDEFEVLLPGTNGENAFPVAEKIRTKIAKIKLPQDRKVTATMGVAVFPRNALDAQSLFLRADEALYEGKAAGRNRTVRSEAKESSLPAPNLLRGQNSPLLTSFPSPRMLSPSSAQLPALGPDAGVAEQGPPQFDEPALSAPPGLDSQTNEQVDGHRVVKRLGTGSTGEVLLVRQPDLNREVALKRPITSNLTPDQIAAFENEARVTASLDHPGVITVHMLGRDTDGRRYYTMKPLHGSSLDHILEGRRQGDMKLLREYTMHRLAEILQRVSETIAYAHQRAVAHFDLSPSNIVVGQFGEVTIIDWGSSNSTRGKPEKRAKKGRNTGQLAFLVGSPAYMAPELLPGSESEPGHAADVYALGAILYEMLTDRPPFLRETTRETLDALKKGEVTPPELAAPEAGIDPALSGLCLKALSPDPRLRPTAVEFSEQLGRHVRKETAWELIHFGDGAGKHPLKAEEWTRVRGEWKIEDGAWIAPSDGEHILLWKVPVPGAFRFVCEAWSEGNGEGRELSLIGRGPSADLDWEQIDRTANHAYAGYCFQFGAEFLTCTKIARHAVDIVAIAGLAPEPGRHYRLELEYDDGWLRGFIDGKLTLSYRELFPATGIHIGLYAFGAGTCYRPIEVHRETWGIQVPAIWVADELFRHRSYDGALERYREYANRFPRRMEGSEARLKAGICEVRLGRAEAARQTFRSLAGTPFESYGMAEEARLDLCRDPVDAGHGLALLRDLLKRFPDSFAKADIAEMAQENHYGYEPFRGIPAAEAYAITLGLDELASQISKPPVQSQIESANNMTRVLHRLARWDEALERVTKFSKSLHPRQFHIHNWRSSMAVAALAVGRDDLLQSAEDMFPWTLFHNPDWATDVALHLMVRKSGVEDLLKNRESTKFAAVHWHDHTARLAVLLALLAAHQTDEAMEWLNKMLPVMDGRTPPFQIGAALSDSRVEPLFKQWVDFARAHPKSVTDYALRTVTARWELEGGNFEKAAAILEGMDAPRRKEYFYDSIVLQVLLSSLGVLKSPSRDELIQGRTISLAGTQFDLTEMFLGNKAPHPNELWPHRLWRPEWRLWLALWHEARGDKQSAREIALPARDERYGLTHSQPALAALLTRT